MFQSGVGGGISSHTTPMSKQSTDSMDVGYAGANDMAKNGLSANQNQVNMSCRDLPYIYRKVESLICLILAKKTHLFLKISFNYF